MLPAIGAIVFWVGVVVAAYVVLRCVEMFSASGAQERSKVAQALAAVVLIAVVVAMLQAYNHYDAMMTAAQDPGSRF